MQQMLQHSALQIKGKHTKQGVNLHLLTCLRVIIKMFFIYKKGNIFKNKPPKKWTTFVMIKTKHKKF